MGNNVRKQNPEMSPPASKVPTSHGLPLAARGLIAACIVLLAGLATFMLVRTDFWRARTNDRQGSFALDLTDQMTIDPELIDYQQVASIDLTMQKLSAIASGPQDEIYVAGDRAIHVFGAGGEPQHVINLDFQPQCLAVEAADQAEPGRFSWDHPLESKS